MTHDTLLVVMSDNGGSIVANEVPSSNYPLRGGKLTNFEGGIKVLGMVKYPSKLGARAGSTWNGLVHISDWYATFCHLAGIEADDGMEVPIDGINIWPSLSTGTTSPRTELWLSGTYRVGEMKLIRPFFSGIPGRAGWSLEIAPNTSVPDNDGPEISCNPACLYNLTADEREEVDLFHVDGFSELAASMLRWLQVKDELLKVPDRDAERFSEEEMASLQDQGCVHLKSAGWLFPFLDGQMDTASTWWNDGSPF